jgi:hypothetical protein
MKVYCVFEDSGYEGIELKLKKIFYNEADADKFVNDARLYQVRIKQSFDVE